MTDGESLTWEHEDHDWATRATRRRRVLMLTHRVPYPLDRGDRIRGYHILEYLSRWYDVSIACTSDEPVSKEQRRVLYRLAHHVAIQRISPLYGKARGAAALLTGGAVTPACYYRRGLAKTIKRWHSNEPFDVVLTYCTGMVGYARELIGRRIRKPQGGANRPRHVIDLVDVDSAKWLDYAQHARVPMRWVYGAESRRLRRIEAGQYDDFDGIAVVSDAEAQLYRRHVGDHPGLTVVRHAVDLDYFQPLPDADTKTIMFVGVLNYKPNAQGIAWFVNEVMPLLAKRVEGVRLKIVGRHPTPAVKALGDQPGVEVVGPVPDVRQYLAQATAVVAPLQIARGVQTKVLEAMACGRAVVCSRGAADGIKAEDSVHLLVADTPHQWVDSLEEVLTDPAQRTRLSVMARGQVERYYDWERCLEPLNSLLDGDHESLSVTDTKDVSKAA